MRKRYSRKRVPKRGRKRRFVRRGRVRRKIARKAVRKAVRKVSNRRAINRFTKLAVKTGVVDKKRIVALGYANPTSLTHPAAGYCKMRDGSFWIDIVTGVTGTGTLYPPIAPSGAKTGHQRYDSDLYYTDPNKLPHCPVRFVNKKELSWIVMPFYIPQDSDQDGWARDIKGDSCMLKGVTASFSVGYRDVSGAPEASEVNWLRCVLLRCSWPTDSPAAQEGGYGSAAYTKFEENIKDILPDPLVSQNRPYYSCPLECGPANMVKHPRYIDPVHVHEISLTVLAERRFAAKQGTTDLADRWPTQIMTKGLREKLERPQTLPSAATPKSNAFTPQLKHWYAFAFIQSCPGDFVSNENDSYVSEGWFIENLRLTTTFDDS